MWIAMRAVLLLVLGLLGLPGVLGADEGMDLTLRLAPPSPATPRAPALPNLPQHLAPPPRVAPVPPVLPMPPVPRLVPVVQGPVMHVPILVGVPVSVAGPSGAGDAVAQTWDAARTELQRQWARYASDHQHDVLPRPVIDGTFSPTRARLLAARIHRLRDVRKLAWELDAGRSFLPRERRTWKAGFADWHQLARLHAPNNREMAANDELLRLAERDLALLQRTEAFIPRVAYPYPVL